MRNHNALIKYIESVKDKKFEWFLHDCVTFQNNCERAYTGENLLPNMIKTYNNLKSAIKVIKSMGQISLYHIMLKTLGAPIQISKAKRGDIVYKKDGLEGASLGRCMGEISYFVGEQGLIAIKTMDLKIAWAR